MAHLTLLKPDGSKYSLQRTHPFVCSVEKAEQARDLLGQDVVNVEVQSAQPVPFTLGDQIKVFGRYYTLNVIPDAQKSANRDFKYNLTFEGPQSDLISANFFNTDSSGGYTGAEFSLTGNLELCIDVLINNCNRKFGAGIWLKGDVLSTDVKTLTFSSMNCLEALAQVICKEFEVEYEIEQYGDAKTITVKKIGEILTDVYQYGQGKGLYTLTRRPVKETKIVNRLFPFGSSENLKPGYRNFADKLLIGDPGSGEDYIEDAGSIAAFGLVEGIKVFEDVKPHRIGVVTLVGVDSPDLFFDGTMNFDLNETNEFGTKYLIAGKSAKIHFNTGDLAGYEFELLQNGYDHESKSFQIIPLKDSKGVSIPGLVEPFTIKVGDTYVILDITMPDSYVTAAEAELRTKAQLYLDANKAPLVSYSLSVTPAFLQNKTSAGVIPNFFSLGDYIQIKDTDLAIDKSSRVTRFTRDVLNPFSYALEIADSYQISIVNRVVSEVKEIKTIVKLNDLRNPVKARAAYKSAAEFFNESFDPDGLLKDGKIKAETLQAAVALFGTEGQQFQVINTVFMPNYLGDENTLRYTAGQIVHLTIEADPRSWSFNSGSVGFGNDTFKYVYAKCKKSDNTATILFSENQIKTKEDPSYYHFLMGMISSVDDATHTRRLSLSYGFTLISGRHITTGVIQSSQGDTYFDLDNGEIGGNITFRASNGINKPISQLETEVLALIDGIAEQTDGQVENWFLNGLPTLSNEPAINWTTAEIKDAHIGDNYFDNVSKKSYRFRYDSGSYSWQEVTDDRITQALLLASQAKDTADGKRRIFITQPAPPYDQGDMWNKSTGLMICKTQRLTGSFNALDWDLATVYDNTVTAINGGMAVTGALYLANEDGTVKAGIQGGGSGDEAIRLFLGASIVNQALAPLRAFQSGEIELRKKLEVFNSSNIGMAGICGFNVSGDGPVVAWFGTPYANRNTAPTRIEIDKFITTKARIGGWEIDNSGLTNQDGSGYIIARSGTGPNITEAMIGANVFPSTSGSKGAASFKAKETGGSGHNIAVLMRAGGANAGFQNFAIVADEGKSLVQEGLFNGRSTYKETISTSITRGIDPSIYDFVEINPTAGVVGLAFITPVFPLASGKEISIVNVNDDFNDFFLVGIQRNGAPFRMNGGVMVTIKYASGFWYLASTFDNNW